MGYLTTITIKNDRLDEFLENPIQLAGDISKGVALANYRNKSVSLCGNYIEIQKNRHADDNTVYLHTGNTVFDLCPYSKDFEELLARNPKLAEDFVRRAQRIITDCKKKIKSKK